MVVAHGKDATVDMDDAVDAGATLQDISAFVDQSDFARVVELADTTNYGDEDRSWIAGLGTGSLSMGGPWDPTLDGYFGSTFDFETARSIRYRPEGDASPSFTFEAFIESYTVGPPVDDAIRWNATLRPTDAITRA